MLQKVFKIISNWVDIKKKCCSGVIRNFFFLHNWGRFFTIRSSKFEPSIFLPIHPPQLKIDTALYFDYNSKLSVSFCTKFITPQMWTRMNIHAHIHSRYKAMQTEYCFLLHSLLSHFIKQTFYESFNYSIKPW